MTKINSIKTSNGSVHKIDEGIGFPGNKYIDFEWTASTLDFTAPANGWFTAHAVASAADAYFIVHDLDNDMLQTEQVNGAGHTLGICFPCAKGHRIQAITGHRGLSSLSCVRFIYAQGSEPED